MAAVGLARVRDRVVRACERAGRDPADVTVVAVSKGRSPDEIMQLHGAGHRDFGENRAEELASKAPLLPGDIRWHMVGTVQRRKIASMVPHVALLHSLDRESLLRSWSFLDSPPPVLLQVNVAAEGQKHGAAPEAVPDLLLEAGRVGVAVTGLMTIPPRPAHPEDSRQWFAALRALRDEQRSRFPDLHLLSMGMTEDFEIAVEEGASFIRVGRAIFDLMPDPA